MEISADCNNCGKTFTYTRLAGPGRKRRFCSQACKRVFCRRRVAPKVCRSCGKSFRPRYGKKDGVCSFACRPQNAHPPKTPRLYPEGVTRREALRASKVEGFKREEIFERDRWTCQLCGEPVERGPDASRDRRASLDHIVPLARGGTHTRENVQCTHWICNSRKTFLIGVYPQKRENGSAAL